MIFRWHLRIMSHVQNPNFTEERAKDIYQF